MLIDDIVDLLSREEGSLTTALLKTKVLLHKIGKKDLVGWVNAELNGYGPEDDVPDYRIVSARVLADVTSYTFKANGHPIPIQHLSEDERRKLNTHEIRFPAGVLEVDGNELQLMIPLPMEANSLLGQQLASGVHINRAWCALNGKEVQGISINVRSRLLDFVLELRDALGEEAEDSDIAEKSKSIDTQAIFANAIHGSNNTIIVGAGSGPISVAVQAGNMGSLENALSQVGLPTEEIHELKQALAADKAKGLVSMEGDAGKWFTSLMAKAAKGTLKIGVEVVTTTVAKALTSYMQGG